MLITERIEISGTPFIHNYSDSGFMIEREDGKRFSDAKDLAIENHTYIETDIPAESDVDPQPETDLIVQNNNMKNKVLNMYTDIKEWRDPKDSKDSYNRGDKCYYKEQFWISAIDNNISEPGGLANTWINI